MASIKYGAATGQQAGRAEANPNPNPNPIYHRSVLSDTTNPNPNRHEVTLTPTLTHHY